MAAKEKKAVRPSFEDVMLTLDEPSEEQIFSISASPPSHPQYMLHVDVEANLDQIVYVGRSPFTPTEEQYSPTAPALGTPASMPTTPPSPPAKVSPPQKRCRTESMPQNQPNYEDPLLNLTAAAIDASPATSSLCSPYEIDTDDTDNEDPIGHKGGQSTAPAQHWSRNNEFWDQVEEKLLSSVMEPWFNTRFFNTSALMQPWGFEACLMEIANYMKNEIQAKVLHYKIGITGEEPRLRWFRKDCGYAWEHLHDHRFTGMALLYAAPSSNPEKEETTGRMEIRLNDFFNWDLDPACLNRPGGGGECASRASPHFVYVAW